MKEKTETMSREDVLVITDFDGTLCTVDMGNRILNHFTRDGWKGIDDAYLRGDIGSRSAYTQIAPFLTGTPGEMIDFVRRHGGVDPYFGEFLKMCRTFGIDIQIVSDGLHFYIDAILKKCGFSEIPFIANRLICGEDGSYTMAFPDYNGFCGRCGTCKRSVVEDRRRSYGRIVYIGDGHSDVCPSQHVDLVFAKGFLYKKCTEDGTACVPFEHFGDITAYLEDWLSR
jgi:2-hydroxy-3-keto-5-methylthiopentenyl-1-phosphate phosphatase